MCYLNGFQHNSQQIYATKNCVLAYARATLDLTRLCVCVLQMYVAGRRRQSMEELIILLTIKKNLFGFHTHEACGRRQADEKKKKNGFFFICFVSTCSRHFHLFILFFFNLDTVIHDRAIRFIVVIRFVQWQISYWISCVCSGWVELCDVDGKKKKNEMKLSYI